MRVLDTIRMLAPALAALATIASAPGEAAAQSPPFQFIPVSVACTGQGQDCEPAFTTTVQSGGELWLQFQASPGHCSTINVDIRVDGQFIGNTGSLGAGASSRFFDAGPVSSGSHTVALAAHGQTGGCNDGSLHSWAGTLVVSASDDEELSFTYFDRRGVEHPMVQSGGEIIFRGTGWDESLEEITVSFAGDRSPVAVFPPQARFEGTLAIDDRLLELPDRGCDLTLVATQRNSAGQVAIERRVLVDVIEKIQVLYAFGYVTINGDLVETGDAVCTIPTDADGDPQVNVQLAPDAADVLNFPSTNSGLVISNPGANIRLENGGLRTPLLNMATSRRGEVAHVTTDARIDVHSQDPCPSGPCEGGVEEVAPVIRRDLSVTNIAKSAGSLRVDGKLQMGGGILYVAGDLEVLGGITGRGDILVEGAVVVRGPVNLSPNNEGPRGQALVAERSVVLLGTSGARRAP